MELRYGGAYPLPDDASPVAVSRTGSTEVYAVDGGFLEVQYLRSGKAIGNITTEMPNWAKTQLI